MRARIRFNCEIFIHGNRFGSFYEQILLNYVLGRLYSMRSKVTKYLKTSIDKSEVSEILHSPQIVRRMQIENSEGYPKKKNIHYFSKYKSYSHFCVPSGIYRNNLNFFVLKACRAHGTPGSIRHWMNYTIMVLLKSNLCWKTFWFFQFIFFSFWNFKFINWFIV